jgi:O-antigen/teichoic acid export membrane protein
MTTVSPMRSSVFARWRSALGGLDLRTVLAYRSLLLLDQVFFSATNFILTITLARAYSDEAFAAFGVGLSIALVAATVQKLIYIFRFSLMTPRTAGRYSPGVIAEHLLVLIGLAVPLAGGAVAAVALGVQGFPRYLALSVLVCGLIYCQVEFDRALQIKRGSAVGAFLLSFLYFLAVLLLAGLTYAVALPFELFMAGLAIFSVTKGAWIAASGARPRWRWGWRFLKQDLRQHGVSGGLITAAHAGFTHVPVMVLAGVSSAAQVATFIAMRSLTQPLSLILRSFDAADKNRLRTASGGTVAGARRVFWLTFLAYGGVPLLGLALISLGPEVLIRLAYGGKYMDSGHLLLAWCLFFTLLGVTNPQWSIVRLFDKDRVFTRWYLASAVLGTALAALLSPHLGADGAMIASLAGVTLLVLGGLATIRDVAFGIGDAVLPSERRGRPAAARPLG